jgi:hypothetical protein
MRRERVQRRKLKYAKIIPATIKSWCIKCWKGGSFILYWSDGLLEGFLDERYYKEDLIKPKRREEP